MADPGKKFPLDVATFFPIPIEHIAAAPISTYNVAGLEIHTLKRM